ncbi:MAG: slipin family protein [Rhodospirillaceae bacterium]|nr:slipin family protein [Rhodospirillaceae bacterium]
MVFKIDRIADTELGLLYRDRVFQKVLGPGVHRRVGAGRTEVHKLDLMRLPVSDKKLDALYMTHPAVVAEHFTVADMADTELGLVYADGKLIDMIGPGSRAFYAKGLREIAVRSIDADREIEVPKALVAPFGLMKATHFVLPVEVPSDHVGLLYVDGVFHRQLAPGRYAFIRAVHRVDSVILDLRLQTLEVTGQEVLTRDRIGLRANLTAVYRIADPAVAVSVAADLRDHLYKALQFALRQVIGTRTLEEVLGDKQGINAAIAEHLAGDLAETGVEVPSVGVKDIILPGDVRELMNRVIEAEKTAQANVIKRREETAATRSLLNTAKLMEDNPVLLRLKELEALEKVSEKVGNVIVGNGMDGVLEDLVRIRPKQGKEA